MKKLLVFILIIGLAFMVGGATCLQNVQEKICNAPDNVVGVADVVIGLLKPVAITLVPASAPYVALVTAQGIKSTGCAAVTDLNTMIAWINTFNATQGTAKALKYGEVAPRTIDPGPLYEWLGKAGK